MSSYLIRKLVASMGMVLGILLLTFGIFVIAPGDPAQILSQEGASQEQINHLRHQMGLDRPVPVQFLIFVRDAVTGNLGTSIYTKQPVTEMISDRMPLTLLLAFGGIFWSTLLAIPIGTLAAVRRGSFVDFGTIGVSLLGVATPVFWRGLILILVFGLWIPILPISGVAPPGAGAGAEAKYLLLPWFSLGLTSLGVVVRVIRTSVLEQLNQDYAMTARAKGLRERSIMYRHVVRNALVPVITVVGIQFVSLLSGAVLTETVFGLPGVGSMMINAITQRDYAVVEGTLIVVGLLFVIVNLLIDLSYAIADPRVRLR